MMIKQIAKVNPKVNAVIIVDYEGARLVQSGLRFLQNMIPFEWIYVSIEVSSSYLVKLSFFPSHINKQPSHCDSCNNEKCFAVFSKER